MSDILTEEEEKEFFTKLKYNWVYWRQVNECSADSFFEFMCWHASAHLALQNYSKEDFHGVLENMKKTYEKVHSAKHVFEYKPVDTNKPFCC